MKTVFHILLLLLSVQTVSGQSDSLFSAVNRAQQQRLEHIFSKERDSVFSHFDQTIEHLLHSSESCQTLPDTSLHYFLVNQLEDVSDRQTLVYTIMNNVVITSSDRINIYSWDDLGGGSSHDYTNYLLYADDLGNCVTQQLNTSHDDYEVGYYQIIPKGNSYTILGCGSYGSGMQHFVIQTFNYTSGSVGKFQTIYIGSNRSQEIDLTYDAASGIISYNEYAFDEEMGFYADEYQVVKLKYENGQWLKQ